MENKTTKMKQRRFVLFSLLAVFFISIMKWFRFSSVSKPKQTAKMLTQDGTLVDVDVERISKKEKISDKELQQWVKRQ